MDFEIRVLCSHHLLGAAGVGELQAQGRARGRAGETVHLPGAGPHPVVRQQTAPSCYQT